MIPTEKFCYWIHYPGRDALDFDIKWFDALEFVEFLTNKIEMYEEVTFVCQANSQSDEQTIYENVKECWSEEKIVYIDENNEGCRIDYAIIMNTKLGKTVFFENGNNAFTSIYFYNDSSNR